MDITKNTFEPKLFKCTIDNSKSLEYNLKAMAECKCCPRHMTCRPEFDMMKILLDNQNEKEVKKIRDHIKNNGIVRVGIESIKFVFSDSFYQIASFIYDITKLSPEKYSELQYMSETVVSYYEKLLSTFYQTSSVAILCKIFEYKIMNIIIDEDFLTKASKKDKGEYLERILKWAIETYDDLKTIRYMETHHLNENATKALHSQNKEQCKEIDVCLCNCRRKLRESCGI